MMEDGQVVGWILGVVSGGGLLGAILKGYGTQRVHSQRIQELSVHEGECTEDRRKLDVTISEIGRDMKHLRSEQREIRDDVKSLVRSMNGKIK